MRWLAKACGTATSTLGALAACLLVASGCGTGIARPPAAAPRVEVAHPRAEKDVEEKDDFIGRMDSVQSVTVQARVFGYLDKILFNDGQMVDVGTPLFEIDPEVYDASHRQDLAQIEIAAAELKLAESKLERNKALLDKNAITKELYDETVAYRDEAVARLDSTKANANRSKLDLEFTKIASPIKGRIDRTFVTKGNLVQGGSTGATELTRVVSVDPIYVYFEIEDKLQVKYVSILRKKELWKEDKEVKDWNIPVEILLPGTDGEYRVGKLDFAENLVDQNTATRQIRATVSNEDRRFSGGMFVKVRMGIEAAYDAVSIDPRAVQVDLSAKRFVFVLGKDDKVEQRFVETGPSREGRLVIKKGLTASDRVIVNGFLRVKVGDAVEIMPPRSDAALAAAADSGTAASGTAAATSAGTETSGTPAASPAATAPSVVPATSVVPASSVVPAPTPAGTR